VLIFLLLFAPVAEAAPSRIVVGVGYNEVIPVQELRRAAIADSTIAKVKAVPPNQVLVTGKKPGHTMLRLWAGGKTLAYEVDVLSLDQYRQYLGSQHERVVKIDLEFLEISDSVRKSYGMKWPERVAIAGSVLGKYGPAVSETNAAVSAQSTQGFLNLLVGEGFARVLARPELYVRLGEKATFHSGGEFPVVTRYSFFGKNVRNVEWKRYGITVNVLPKSFDRVHFQADVEIEISEIDMATLDKEIPSLKRRELNTKINSVDGETTLLSGLIRQVAAESTEGIPILSDIPLLGLLFKREKMDRVENEIMMAVRFSMGRPKESWQRYQHLKQELSR